MHIHRHAIDLVGGEPQRLHQPARILRRKSTLATVLNTVRIRPGSGVISGCQRNNPQRFQRKQLIRAGDAVAVLVLPDPQMGKRHILRIHPAIAVIIQRRQSRKTVRRQLAGRQPRFIAEQLRTVADAHRPVGKIHQQAVFRRNPRQLLGKTAVVHVEMHPARERQRANLAVAVQIKGERVKRHRREKRFPRIRFTAGFRAMLRTNARTEKCTQRTSGDTACKTTGESTEDGTNGQSAGVGRIIAIFVAAVFVAIAVVTVFVGIAVVAVFVGVAVVAVFIAIAVVAGSRRERTVIRIGRIKAATRTP